MIGKKKTEKAEEIDNLEIARKKAEELDKFLQDRLSEDDYKTVERLLKEVVFLSIADVKDAIRKSK